MPMFLKLLPVLALLAWVAPLAAQETAPAAAEDPTVRAPAEEARAGQVPANPAAESAPATPGEPAGAGVEEPQIGQSYIREEFRDWRLTCIRTETGPEPCAIYQLLLDDDGNPVAQISIAPLPEGQEAAARADVVVPLLTLLTEDVTISVEGGSARRYPISFCNESGCVARVGLTAEMVDQFRHGATGQLSIVPVQAPDQPVTLGISLVGFTAAYRAAQVAAAEAAAAQPAE